MILGNIKLCVIPVKWFYNLFSGEDFLVVQKEVHDLLKGRILVGHALQNDMKVSWSLCKTKIRWSFKASNVNLRCKWKCIETCCQFPLLTLFHKVNGDVNTPGVRCWCIPATAFCKHEFMLHAKSKHRSIHLYCAWSRQVTHFAQN